MSAELVDPTEYTPDETELLDDREPPATPEEEETYSPEEAFEILSVAVGAVEVDSIYLNETAVSMEATTWQDAARLLKRLRGARQLAQVVENGLERHIAEARIKEGVKDPVEVPGVGVVTHRRTAKKTTWDSDALLVQVMHAFAAEDPDGQLPDVFQYRDLIQEAAAFGYWRTGALKKLGIDPNEYRKVESGRLTVDIQAGDN